MKDLDALYMCIHICTIYVYSYICVYIYIHCTRWIWKTWMTRIYMSVYIYIYILMYICTYHIYTEPGEYERLGCLIYVYTYMFCICVLIYIGVYIHTLYQLDMKDLDDLYICIYMYKLYIYTYIYMYILYVHCTRWIWKIWMILARRLCRWVGGLVGERVGRWVGVLSERGNESVGVSLWVVGWVNGCAGFQKIVETDENLEFGYTYLIWIQSVEFSLSFFVAAETLHLVQPIAFGVSFLQSRISIDNLVLWFLLQRSVEKRPIRLRLEIKVKWHTICNRLYIHMYIVYWNDTPNAVGCTYICI